MFKLFIKVYFFVLIAFIGLIISIIALPDLLLADQSALVFQQRLSKGTFALLDQAIAGLNEAEIKQKIAHYQTIFQASFDLVALDRLDLNAEEKQILKNAPLYKEYEENNLIFFYRQSQHTDKIWQILSDTNFSLSIEDGLIPVVSGHSFMHGVLFLIEEKLKQHKPSQWQQIIKKLQPLYAYQISLNKKSDYSLTQQETKKLKQYQPVNLSNGTDKITFIQQIKDDDNLVLQFGSIQIPWIIYYFIYILLFFFAIIISIITLIWVWPLWKDLSKIKQAALDFGAGHYDTRIPSQKFSSLSPIRHAFNNMAEQTQRSINSHKELTCAVSHELRTPVARMRFSLEMLLSAKNKQDKVRYINDITQDIDELDLLLAELLSYARFDNNDQQIMKQSEQLVTWFNQTMQRLALLSNYKTFVYSVKGITENERALFEPRLMARVVDNLVQNAFHYAKHQVNVILSKTPTHYQLIVEDDGIGVPEAEYQRIFDAFSRIDQSRDRHSGGFGLGLAIAKRIVKGHKGEIIITKSTLGGAKFEVQWLMVTNLEES